MISILSVSAVNATDIAELNTNLTKTTNGHSPNVGINSVVNSTGVKPVNYSVSKMENNTVIKDKSLSYVKESYNKPKYKKVYYKTKILVKTKTKYKSWYKTKNGKRKYYWSYKTVYKYKTVTKFKYIKINNPEDNNKPNINNSNNPNKPNNNSNTNESNSDLNNSSKYLKSNKNCPVNNSKITNLVKNITSNSDSNLTKAKKIFNWVKDKISYSFYYNTKKGALKTLSSKSGNCIDKAHLLSAMLRNAKIPTVYMHGKCKFKSGLNVGHVWVRAYIGGKWHDLDSSSKMNSFNKINNWNTKTVQIKGTYTELMF